MSTLHQSVQDYYGKELNTTQDLKTSACCTLDDPPSHIKEILSTLHDEVLTKYYGCGLTIPDHLEGLNILDLGSGSGRDVYIASSLVGATGNVVGIDMTDEQLEVAQKHILFHQNVMGYEKCNVKFLKGNLDELGAVKLEKESFDLIISNCVINLVEDKLKVLSEAYDLLKFGGEMYFSDVYCDRRVPTSLKTDPVLWGECLSGALYWNDFLKIARKAGFTDPRSVEAHPIAIENETLEKKLGNLKFYSVTYRLFKIDGLEEDCEDFGQAVTYKGSIKHLPDTIHLDDHHEFPTGKIITVCGNTYKMLHDTRYKDHFDFYGNMNTHYGIFEGCGGAMPFSDNNDEGAVSCC